MDGIGDRVRALHRATEERVGTDDKAVFQALTGLDAGGRRALVAEYQHTFGHDLVTVLRSELSGAKLQRAESLLQTGSADWSSSAIDYRLEGLGDSFKEVVESVRHHPLVTTGIVAGGIALGHKAPAAAAVVGLGFLVSGAVKVVKNEIQAHTAGTEEERARHLIASGEGLGQTLMAIPGTGRSLTLVEGGLRTAVETEGTLGSRAMAFFSYKPPRTIPNILGSAGHTESLGKSVAAFYESAVTEAIAPMAEHINDLSVADREALVAMAIDPTFLSELAKMPNDPAALLRMARTTINPTQRAFLLKLAKSGALLDSVNSLNKLFGPTLEAMRTLPIEQQRALLHLLTDLKVLKQPPGEVFARLLLVLGPGHVKLGQIAADAGELPAELAGALKQLQGSISPMSETELAERLAAAGMEKYKPGKVLGVASIGQVNEAVAPDGEQVVIKVLRAGVSRQAVEGEFRLLDALLEPYRKTLTPEKAGLLDDALANFKAGVLDELDFNKEAANIELFNKTYAGQKAFSGIKLRTVSPDGSVLVMSSARGVHISEIKDAVQRVRAGENLAKSISRQTFEDGIFHADPHPGNFRVMPDGSIEFLDMGAVGRVSAADRLALQELCVYLLVQDSNRLANQMIAQAGSITSSLSKPQLQAELAAKFSTYFASQAEGMPRLLKSLDQLQQIASDLGVHQKKGSFWLIKTLYTTNNVFRQLKPDGELAMEAIPAAIRGLYKSFKENPALLKSHIIDLALLVGSHPRKLVQTLIAMGVADPARMSDIPRGFYVALQALQFEDN